MTFAVFLPTPGKVINSSIVCGTCSPKRSVTALLEAMRCFALFLKKPVERMSCSTSRRSAAASSAGLRYRRKSEGVTWLTRWSVHWAERIVAMSNSQGERWSSSVFGLGVVRWSVFAISWKRLRRPTDGKDFVVMAGTSAGQVCNGLRPRCKRECRGCRFRGRAVHRDERGQPFFEVLDQWGQGLLMQSRNPDRAVAPTQELRLSGRKLIALVEYQDRGS